MSALVVRAAWRHAPKLAPRVLKTAYKYLLHPNYALRSARLFWISKDSRDLAHHVKHKRPKIHHALTILQLLSDIGCASSVHANGVDFAFRILRAAAFVPADVWTHSEEVKSRFRHNCQELIQAIRELPHRHRSRELHAGHIVAPGHRAFELACHVHDDVCDLAAVLVRVAALHWARLVLETHRFQQASELSAHVADRTGALIAFAAFLGQRGSTSSSPHPPSRATPPSRQPGPRCLWRGARRESAAVEGAAAGRRRSFWSAPVPVLAAFARAAKPAAKGRHRSRSVDGVEALGIWQARAFS